VNFAPKLRNSAGVIGLVQVVQLPEELLLLDLILAHLYLLVVIVEVPQPF